jgi:hypothetical protein
MHEDEKKPRIVVECDKSDRSTEEGVRAVLEERLQELMGWFRERNVTQHLLYLG